jgi:hypothetical protein
LGNLTSNNNTVKISKLPKTYDFRRLNSSEFGSIVKNNIMAPKYNGGGLPVPPGVEDNWILAQGPNYDFELSVLMTQDDRLLVWK